MRTMRILPMRRKMGLRTKFVVVALGVYLVMSVVALITLRGVIDRITANLGAGYAAKYALANCALLREPLDREITLAHLMADSPIIREWILNEQDGLARAKALAELESYRQRLGEKSWFLAMNGSLNYYFDDENHRYGDSKLAYRLDRDEQKDHWYFATIADVPDFAINVNYDHVLQAHKVWVNVVVRGPGNAPLGVIGTGLDLSGFLNRTVDTAEPGVQNIVLDQRLAIQAHRNRGLIDDHSLAKREEERSTIRRLITDPGERADLEALLSRLQDGRKVTDTCFVTVNGHRHVLGAAHIKSLQWYSLSILDIDEVITRRLFVPIFVSGLLLTLLLAAIIGFLLNQMILRPVTEVTTAARKIAQGEYAEVSCTLRTDELGELMRTFAEMSANVRDARDHLEQRIEERTEQLNESNRRLTENMAHLEELLANLRTLEGIIPICASCKKIRDDKGYWTQVEAYISKHSLAEFSHGLCPECLRRYYPRLTKDTFPEE